MTIIEFSDFQCPFCGRHFQQTFGSLEKKYVATGKVRYVFRHFPLERIHPQAFKAGEAAECAAAQGKFWERHDRLFAHQHALMPDICRRTPGPLASMNRSSRRVSPGRRRPGAAPTWRSARRRA